MYVKDGNNLRLMVSDKPVNLMSEINDDYSLTCSLGFLDEKTECEVKVNNKNNKVFKCIKCKIPKLRKNNIPNEIIVQGDTSVFKYINHDKVILHKSEEDEFNLEYAFLYAYFVHNSGMSKGEASRFLKSLVEDENE